MAVTKLGVAMAEITFSNYRILVCSGIDYIPLNINNLCKIKFPDNFIYEYNDLVYDISLDLIENNYLWFYAKYGNPNPCPIKVLDKNQKEYTDNNRTPNQVEMRHQFFALLDFKQNVLYISNSTKKKFYEQLLKQKINLDVSIRPIFVDLDEFDKKIKELKSVKFTSLDNLFTANSELKNAFIDYLGYDANIDFTIELDCKNKPLNKSKLIQRLKGISNRQEVKDLVIIGENDEQFEQVFNAGSFNKKITIFITENQEKQFDEIEVKTRIMETLKNV